MCPESRSTPELAPRVMPPFAVRAEVVHAVDQGDPRRGQAGREQEQDREEPEGQRVPHPCNVRMGRPHRRIACSLVSGELRRARKIRR